MFSPILFARVTIGAPAFPVFRIEFITVFNVMTEIISTGSSSSSGPYS